MLRRNDCGNVESSQCSHPKKRMISPSSVFTTDGQPSQSPVIGRLANLASEADQCLILFTQVQAVSKRGRSTKHQSHAVWSCSAASIRQRLAPQYQIDSATIGSFQNHAHHCKQSLASQGLEHQDQTLGNPTTGPWCMFIIACRGFDLIDVKCKEYNRLVGSPASQ